MSERQLATVRRINEISPIENSDFLELATVDGWNVVVAKAEGHKAGDLVVYCETDSFLPRWPEFQFLEKSSLRKMTTPDGSVEGYRLRTIKLRGQISEGLVIKLQSITSDIEETETTWFIDLPSLSEVHLVDEGDEVTEILGIIKWELPVHASLAGKVRGNFPHFLQKTDSERIENFYKHLVRKHINDTWEMTMKLDGSSFTAYYNDEEFGVCSRNLDLAETEENSFWIAAHKNGLPEKMAELSKEIGNFAIQGELMGPGVQGNREGFNDLDIYVFDIFDIDNRTKIGARLRHEIVDSLGLKHVPFLGYESMAGKSVSDILAMAEGPSINHKVREGIVFKSVENPDVNFKAIAHSFKLADKD